MAYTTFQKTFWTDDYILKLKRDEKLVYSYLITNDKTRQCGIYELALAKACFELDIPTEELLMILKKFSDDKKIAYSMETQEVCIINWVKHNENTSWKTMESVKKQLMDIKNPMLMLILYDPRKPLFDGKRREKNDKGKYEEVDFVIDNPWKEYFKELSDSDIIEIRAPYTPKKAPWKPLGSPLHGAFTNNKALTDTDTQTGTDTLQDKKNKPKGFNSSYPYDDSEKKHDDFSFSKPFRSPFHNDNPASSLLGEEPSESDEVPKYEDDNKFGTWE